ncbi:MAG: methyltransferase [Planctomycetota bacterium]
MQTDARHAWLAYLVVAFVVTPAVFAIRYRRSPFVVAWPPADRYAWIEIAYAGALAAYTVWLLLAPPIEPVMPLAGTAVALAGLLVVTAAVATLGPNWRVGQDTADPSVEFVARGVYRLLSHPIYAGLLLVGVGLALLDDLLTRAVWYLATTSLYALVQSDAEARRWTPTRAPR